MPPITRRTMLATAAGASLAARAQSAAPPNIVFILADDMGYADVACYGRPDLATPHIDRLAAQGARFVQGYANSAVCSATRTALITGRYQYRLAVGLEEPISAPSKNPGLPPSHPTLPSILKARGYETALIGKWHLGALPDYGPLRSGYDHFWGFRSGGVDYYTHKNLAQKDDLWDGDTPVEVAGYLTDLIGDRAVSAVRSYAGKPFFLSLHFSAPHWPWEAPGDEAESERLRTRSIRDYDGGSQKTYRAMIERLDFQVGRILQALDDTGQADNTIVVFTSDNGGERFADTWPFTGRKTELLEGGLRIPMIIRWPARVTPGMVSEQVAISMDWLPTLLAAAGTVPDPAYPPDGMNLVPHLTGGPAVPRQLFWRYKANAQRAARDGDWKILKIAENTFLFDVVADPMERANLRDRHPDVYDRMVGEWDAWNRTMLPEVRETFTEAFTADQLADHIGARPVSLEPDLVDGWPKPAAR